MSTTDEHERGPVGSPGAAPTIEVFWRPGCPFCQLLRGELQDRDIEAQWRNIWMDGEAREIVRAANHGNETVPTVRIGDRTLTNPKWRDLAPLVGRDPREKRGTFDPGPYASAGACSPAPPEHPPLVAGVRLAAVVGLVGLGWWLAETTSSGLGILTWVVAYLAWTLSRPS